MDRLEQLGVGYLHRRERRLRMTAESCALAAILISAAIFAAWVLHAARLEATFPLLFEMKANSALGYIAAGGALLLIVRGRRTAAARIAMIPLLIGLATLIEYAGIRLPIDELMLRDWSSSAGQHPGRAPPNTAAVLAALGCVFLLLALIDRSQARNIAVRIVCFAIAAVAMEALAGHIAGSSFAIGWGTLQKMSIPSAMCGLMLSIGLLAHGWRTETGLISRLPIWIPALLCFGIALLDVYTPLDLNVGICYIPVVLCALWFERGNVAIAFAAISTMLIILGLFASPAGHIPFWFAATNRSFAIIAVWLVALLVYLQHVARKKLWRSEHHLESAQRIAAIGSFELYFAKMALHGSGVFDAMHGLEAGRAHDWAIFLRQSIPPDERNNLEGVVDAARGGVRSRDLEYSFLRPDGAVRNGVLHCDLLRDAEGAPVGIIGVVHDVTEVRRAQAEQADIEMQLRHAQKLEALGMLAGGIAHDLNNTLVPITTLTPLLIERATHYDAEILQIVMNAARRAKELVREMLVFSRKDQTAHEAIRLDRLVRDSLTIIRAGIPASITIVDKLGDVPEITGSKGQIYQTILNLATNAAHAIGDRAGTITIGATCETGRAMQPAEIRLYVEDDGAGMDSETSARIFEPFFSTKEARQGTGLGLSIVSGIMKSHGGSIAVRSAPGRGTRFDLLFPARAAAVAA
jgi:PAS domain S-box-containing protein